MGKVWGSRATWYVPLAGIGTTKMPLAVVVATPIGLPSWVTVTFTPSATFGLPSMTWQRRPQIVLSRGLPYSCSAVALLKTQPAGWAVVVGVWIGRSADALAAEASTVDARSPNTSASNATPRRRRAPDPNVLSGMLEPQPSDGLAPRR